MQAVIFPAPNSLTLEQVADPSCGVEEVIVQVGQAGICGTDLHLYRSDVPAAYPLIAGHEFAGTIVEVGRSVTHLHCGERVAVDPNLSCGHCHFCRQQAANHCLNWQGIGITRPGAFAEYAAVPARACYPIRDLLTDAQAAFVEPLSCVIHALNRLRVWPGDEVLIFGAGPMGLLLVQALHHGGASQLVVVEKDAARRSLAEQMGATAALDAGPLQAGSLRRLAPHGFAVVVDATGVPAVIEQAFGFLKPRGQYLQFGVAPQRETIRWSPYDAYRNDWTIIGSFALCHTFQPAIDWLVHRVVDVTSLISHTLPLAGFPGAFQAYAEGRTLKVHLRP